MFGSSLDSERTFDSISNVNRTRVRRRGLAMVAGAAIVAAVWAGPAADATGDPRGTLPESSHRYVVRPGDTLWSIAERAGQRGDPRELVDAIASVNGVQAGAIVPGQTLLIPSD
jgi:nucleoid-associated protein YgaU